MSARVCSKCGGAMTHRGKEGGYTRWVCEHCGEEVLQIDKVRRHE